MNTNKYPLISIIVLNYNSKKYLKDCLNSLANINYPKNKHEIILADNASSDDSVEYVHKNFQSIRIVKFDKNYGYAEGNNKAADSAMGEYILFLNPDTTVDVNWLIELAKEIVNGDNGVAIYGSKVLYMDEPTIIQTTGLTLTPMGIGFSIGAGKSSNCFNDSKLITSAEGCSFLIKKNIFHKLGGFDSDYFAYVEELDLGYRAWLNGFKVIYVPTSILYHKFGGNWGGLDSPYRIFFSQKNRLATIVKNFEFCNVIRGLFISFVFDIIRINTFLIKRHFKGVSAVVKGNYYFIKELPKTIKKRKCIQANRKLSDADMYDMGLIGTLGKCVNEYFRI